MGLGVTEREQIARRAASEIKPGMIVNLGIGIPSLVPNFLPTDMQVMLQAENGVLGIGESPEKGNEDENLCNAAGFPVRAVKGASYFDTTMSFAMIRRGMIDITILGALQVSQSGDLANWLVPGKKVPGMGGAMELAQKAKKVVVVMSHTDQKGRPKLTEACTLPLTAAGCVDMIITEKAVLTVGRDHFVLKELMNGSTIDEVIGLTDAEIIVDMPFS
ncbi:3-oxoacid CoA-transferase subunit B [Bacillus mojavensis]|jgi:3-oxoacid CoA-transferase B subunit|uniref:3-oxoacid CoA-transferase subunit B n=1 Tax=Bacillus TaxID=1386 RepID=UPI001454F2DA|nr:3-oxoacid CoA-transferase subunit B [Bacillus mojavensis]MCY8104436.1 3-oxoacid CoA-transferase subunit B [Bacillus mojavensis]MCY8480610.1 3-oxoacid CoA-transferase subunit B [Bacillus mojavensis]MCY9091451.1 3-oxoacid CoA-transferase subunit B [Bacillus mojavensis]MCY9188876.1 3-oxoacid CoA-transferase subunit B [Bacillus mojavensis]MEC1672184.1 3-oxoacid CoA-transferase subunit B [Bacillus mojavensis]